MITAYDAHEVSMKAKDRPYLEIEEQLLIIEEDIKRASVRGFFNIYFNVKRKDIETTNKLIKALEAQNFTVDMFTTHYMTISWDYMKPTERHRTISIPSNTTSNLPTL